MEFETYTIKDFNQNWNEFFLKYFSKEELKELGHKTTGRWTDVYEPIETCFPLPSGMKNISPRQVELFWEIGLIKKRINFNSEKKTKRILTHIDDIYDIGEIELNITLEEIKKMNVVSFRKEHFYGNDSDRWNKTFYYFSEKLSETSYTTYKIESRYFYFNAWSSGGGKCKDFKMKGEASNKLVDIITYLESLNLNEDIYIAELEIRKNEFYDIELQKIKKQEEEEWKETVKEVEELREKVSKLLPSVQREVVRRKINQIGYDVWKLKAFIEALEILSEYHCYWIEKALNIKSKSNVLKFLPDLKNMFERSVLSNTQYCYIAVELMALEKNC